MTNDGIGAREHLFAVFGQDILHLPAELDIAARHHRELAAHLRRREPDALITELGARHLAEGHDTDARRCDRLATAVRRALDDTDGGDSTRDVTPTGRP